MIKFGRQQSAKKQTVAGSGESREAEPKREHPDVVHVDIEQLDTETRAMYRDARLAQDEQLAGESERLSRLREFVVKSPFKLGFVITLGVLSAMVVGAMIGELSTILMYVVGAIFIALALDPVVRWLERKGVKRPVGIAIVFITFLLLVAGILAVVIPMITSQVIQLVRTAPSYFTDVANQPWFKSLDEQFGQYIDFMGLLKIAQDFIGNPSNWAQFAGGVWEAGIGLVNGLTAGLIVLILSLYFLSSLQVTKRAFYSIVTRSMRAQVIDITEQVTKSIGGYVNGIVVLALTNAVLGFIMMSIVGVPFAGLVAVGVFFLALIPLFGSVLATILVAAVALFNSPTAAIVAAAYYLVYMQVEAYVLTPRVMNRVVSVPGALVVIGALAGGTLLGLLGALISIPVTAAVLMIIKQVWVPRQDKL